MVLIYGISFLLLGNGMSEETPHIEPTQVYEAIVDIVGDSKYQDNITEKIWQLYGSMAWESFADYKGIGGENDITKVPFNPIAHTTTNDLLLAVGTLQLNTHHFADWIVESMMQLGYETPYPDIMICHMFKVKKGHWQDDVSDREKEQRQKSYDDAESWLRNPDNRALVLEWAADPRSWDTQVIIAKEAFNDREKQGVFGGEAWDSYKYGQYKKGWNMSDKYFGYGKESQPDIHTDLGLLSISPPEENKEQSLLGALLRTR